VTGSITFEPDDPYNAFLTTCKSAHGSGKLAGVAVAVKDNITTKGIETTCASKILKGYVPPYDAHVVGLLKAAGAAIAGKTNMDEFGMGTTTENSGFGPPSTPATFRASPAGQAGAALPLSPPAWCGWRLAPIPAGPSAARQRSAGS